MDNFSDKSSTLIAIKIFSIAFQKFYEKTNISAKFILTYKPDLGGLGVELGFLPHNPTTEEQISTLFQELEDAEKLVFNDTFMKQAEQFADKKTMMDKYYNEIQHILRKK